MAQKLLIATSNEGKRREFSVLFGSAFDCVSSKDFDQTPPEVIEDGTTYFENALKKAMAYANEYQMPVLADDSGLEVEALGGEPGIHSARFGGEGLGWPERWNAVYQRLGKIPDDEWWARFYCVLCYYDGKGVPQFFEGSVAGLILPEPRGDQGFGYDPIFYSESLKKSFGEATPAEKHRISHRAVAAQAFLQSLGLTA